MRTSAQVSLRILLVIPVLITFTDVSAFNTDTHQVVNDRAAAVSKLSDYLPEQLGLSIGLEETIAGRRVREWIQRGGQAEDEFLANEILGAFFRSRHHFHNPLLPWDQAGLDALSLCPPFKLRGEASVRWAQNPDQGISGKASWADARREFFRALTLPSKAGPDTENRETALARTFQILGQQMHLIADLAVPAHTRNDPHCPAPEGFEAWASRRDNASFIGSLLAGQPKPPDEGIFKLGVPLDDPVARVPIARLWDTDQYNPLNPNPAITLSPTIGLAEYTNANFFSDDTVFRRFPFPAATSVELGPPEPEPKTGERRRYFKKVRDGEGIDHLAVPSALYEFLPDALKDKKIGLDDTVFKDYAAKLLPRAVGYSAALLDYFFRGTLDFTIGGSSPNQTLTITNKSNEAMDGTFTLYADNFSQERSTVKSFDLSLAAQATSAALTFTPPAEVQAYILVFHGRLGLEEGAVAGKVSEVGIGDVQIVGAVLIGPGLGTGKGFVISSASNGAVAVDMTKMFGVPATLPVGARTIAKFVMGNPSKVLFVVEDRDNKKIELFVLQIRRARSDSKLPVTDGTVILGGTQLPELDVELSFHMSHQEKSLELRRLHATANITHRTLDAFVEPDVVTVQTASISRTYRYSFMSKHVVDYYAVEASGVVDILAIVHAPDPVSLPNDQEMETVNWDPVTIPLPYDLGPVTIPPVTPFPVEQKGYLSFPTALVTPHAMPIYISAVAPSVYLVNLVTGSVILRSMEAETSISWNKHYWSSVIPIPLKQNAICPDDCAPGIRFTAEVAGFFFTLPNNYIVDPWKAEFANVQYAVEEGTNPISDVGKSFPILSDLTRGTFNVNNRVFSIVEFTLPQAMLGKPDADAFFVRIVPPTVAASQFFGPDRYVVRWDKAGPDVISGIGLAFPLQVNRQLGTVLGGPTGVLVIDRETESVHPVNQESLSEFDIRSGVIMGERRLYFTGGPVEKMTLLNLTLKDGQIVLSKTSDIAEPREGFPLFVGTAFTGAVFPLSLENKGTALSP